MVILAFGLIMRLIHWPLAFCTAIYPVVFVPQTFEQWPRDYREAILAHERIHHRQQCALGLAKFCFWYAVSRSFRWRIERLGYQRELLYLVKTGYTPDPKSYAYKVSGKLYWAMVDRVTAESWFIHYLDRLK